VRLLLDTHVLVWLAEGTEDLSRASRDQIDRAAAGAGIAVSAISFWETAMLAQRGRISLSQPLRSWRERVVSQPGIIELAVDGEVAIEAVQLPGNLHSDPADRLLAATARIHGCRLATRDQRLLTYGSAGHVSVASV
jgi:PIN domain nuclease of toxin-antitoxin system